MRFTQTVKTTVLVVLAALAQQAVASGYHFGTQSVTAQSTANSSAAEASDATTLFSNPAGLAQLETHQVSGALNFVMPTIKYNGSAQYNRGGTVAGSNSGKITEDVVVAPHVYGAYKLNDRVTLGLGVYVPFASATEYDQNSVLRFNLNQLGLTSIAIEPVVAFKANEQHSFGVGLIAQHSEAELRKYADWSASGRFDAPVAMATGGRLTRATGLVEGYGKVKGDDWGFGYHLGWLFNVNDKLRLGVNYRSKIEHNLEGTANWHPDTSNPNSLFNHPLMGNTVQRAIRASGYVESEGANVKIITPESLSVHGMYKLNPQVNLFGDVTWTRHSRFDSATLHFEKNKSVVNGSQSNQTVLNPNWRDTFRVALGGSYQYSEPLQLRAGLAFDQSPIRSSGDRLNTLPDGNRIWFSVGARYAFNQNHVVDVAYSHIHINDGDFVSPKADGTTVDSKGASTARFKNYANILGLQYTYKF